MLTYPTAAAAAAQNAAQGINGPLVSAHQFLQLAQVLRLLHPVSAVSRQLRHRSSKDLVLKLLLQPDSLCSSPHLGGSLNLLK
jgi:hypothetical protein